MTLKRRDALTLAAGVVLAGAASERASACSRRPPGPFKASSADKRRMAGKLDALRLYWNEDAIADFLRDHCTEHVQINMFLDRRGGSWREALPALGLFRDRYKRINSVHPGVVFDPSWPCLYAFVEFEPPPVPPPGPDDEIILCGGGPVSTFAVSMQFDTMERPGKSLLAEAGPILSGISFRESGQLRNWFASNSI